MWQPLRGAVFLHLVALTMVGSGPAVARARDAAPPAGASGLGLWIALRDVRFCSLSAEQPTTAMPSIAAEFEWTAGLMSPTSLALLTPSGEPDDTGQIDLGARQYGKDGSLATALADHVNAWDAASRPGDNVLQIDVYPITAGNVAPSGATVVTRRWHQFVITWE
jgi:hypothetical protein